MRPRRERGDSGTIYAAKALKLLERKKIDPFDVEDVSIYRPPHISPRIPAQRSVFTVHPDPTADFQGPELYKWTIETEVCGRIKSVLNACAVNYASLFPDLDGLSKHVGWLYKWGRV
jgi:hypothetical protein